VEKHIWMAYYILIGCIFSKYYFDLNDVGEHLWSKVLATLFCFATYYGVKLFILNKIFITYPLFLQQLPWLVISFVVVSSPYVLKKRVL
jgi:hypothetical protein